MHLGDLVLWDARLAVQAVDVLRDDVLELIAAHELDQSHMTRGRDGLLNRCSKINPGSLDHLMALFLCLLDVG